MYHPIDDRFLYCALKINITFRDEYSLARTFSGTAFLLSSEIDKKKVALVTNRHVVEAGFKDPNKKNWKIEKIAFSGYGNSKSYFELLLYDWQLFFPDNPEEDVALVSSNTFFFEKGQEAFSGAINFDLSAVADQAYLDSLNVGDFVVLPGYPEFHDKHTNRPILRSGVIASDPLHDYAGPGMAVGLRTLAYEAFSTAGSSGGPIFALGVGLNTGEGLVGGNYRPPRIIGINAGHINNGPNGGHSGISYFYKSLVLLELLKKLV